MKKIILNEEKYNTYWEILNIVLEVENVEGIKDYEIANKELRIQSNNFEKDIETTIDEIIDNCYIRVNHFKIAELLNNTNYDIVAYTNSNNLNSLVEDNVFYNVRLLLENCIEEIGGIDYE